MNDYWKDKSVVVAGGAGLIGSYLVEQLLEAGAPVLTVDNLSRGSLSNMSKALMKSARFRWANINLLRDLDHRLLDDAKPQVVFNLAAPSYGVGYSNAYQGKMLRDTVTIGINLFGYAEEHEAKMVQVSSSCVYGDDAPVPTPEVCGFQDMPEKANEGYGWAKRTLELQAQYFRRATSLDCLVVRPFNTYGPRVPVYGDSRDPVLVALIRRVLQGENPIRVFGDGTQTRSFMHAKDVATAIRLLAERDGIEEPVNIGTSVEHSMTDLIGYIQDYVGNSNHVEYVGPRVLQGAQRKAADRTLLKHYLPKWKTHNHVPFSTGLQEMINYVRTKLRGA
jgi:nucleoside-diphosphate-sugar epimerase